VNRREIHEAFSRVTPREFCIGFVAGVVLGTLVIVTVVATLWHP
jgi:Mg/Co/Ni transporter MgtE